MVTSSKTALGALAMACGLLVVNPGLSHASVPLGQEYFGVASWYGSAFKGLRTANGEKFNPKALTAAHPTLPFGTLVEVSRPDRKKSVVVCITDRGPFTGRAIDLSRAAARRLHMSYLGTAPVRIQVIGMVE